jgi:hypothetical protein
VTDQTPLEPDDGPDDEPDAASATADGEEVDILEMHDLVADVAETLLDVPFDGITSVERADDGRWRAVFEVVERSAVPDTQDIIGRYELFLSASGDVREYSLQQRFKRSELQGEAL